MFFTAGDRPETLAQGHHPEEEEGKGTAGRGELETGLTCLDDVAPCQAGSLSKGMQSRDLLQPPSLF